MLKQIEVSYSLDSILNILYTPWLFCSGSMYGKSSLYVIVPYANMAVVEI